VEEFAVLEEVAVAVPEAGEGVAFSGLDCMGGGRGRVGMDGGEAPAAGGGGDGEAFCARIGGGGGGVGEYPVVAVCLLRGIGMRVVGSERIQNWMLLQADNKRNTPREKGQTDSPPEESRHRGGHCRGEWLSFRIVIGIHVSRYVVVCS